MSVLGRGHFSCSLSGLTQLLSKVHREKSIIWTTLFFSTCPSHSDFPDTVSTFSISVILHPAWSFKSVSESVLPVCTSDLTNNCMSYMVILYFFVTLTSPWLSWLLFYCLVHWLSSVLESSWSVNFPTDRWVTYRLLDWVTVRADDNLQAVCADHALPWEHCYSSPCLCRLSNQLTSTPATWRPSTFPMLGLIRGVTSAPLLSPLTSWACSHGSF